MGGRSASLISQDEAGTNPHSRGAKHQGSGNRVAVVQTTGSNDLHGLAGQRALAALNQLGHGGNEDGSGDITGVTTALTTLGADDVNADVESLLDVLGVADHVHAEDTSTVELLHDGLGGNTDGGDEEASAALNDDLDELVEFALGVVVAREEEWLVAVVAQTSKVCLLGLTSATTDLRQQEVNTERSLLVSKEALQLGDLLPEHVRCVANTTDDTQTTGVGDCGRQLRASGHVHTSQQNWVVDLEQISDGGTDDL